jgi:Flp pilus assembly protein TadG
MAIRALPALLKKIGAAFSRDSRGVSAVEFALIAPLLITIYIGGVEVTQAVSVSRKTTLIAHTVADLVAQDTSVTSSEMNDILSASAAVAQPYSTSNLQVTVSSILIDANGNATVGWSDTRNGTALQPGSGVTLPAALKVANTSLILGQVNYIYKPMLGSVLTGNINLGDKIYMRPRLANCVVRTPPGTCKTTP